MVFKKALLEMDMSEVCIGQGSLISLQNYKFGFKNGNRLGI